MNAISPVMPTDRLRMQNRSPVPQGTATHRLEYTCGRMPYRFSANSDIGARVKAVRHLGLSDIENHVAFRCAGGKAIIRNADNYQIYPRQTS